MRELSDVKEKRKRATVTSIIIRILGSRETWKRGDGVSGREQLEIK